MRATLLSFAFLFLSFCGYSQTCTLSTSITTGGGTSICPGSSLVLTATASSGTAPYSYVWSTGETTPNITVNKSGTFTVTVTDKTPGCQPVIQSITVTNSTTPATPVVHDALVCPNTPATLTAISPGGTYQWYDAPSGGNFLASGNTYVTQNITGYTLFYVQTTINGCTSPRKSVYADVVPRPVITSDIVCMGSPATITATGADTYAWYDAASGGNLLATSAILNTNPLAQNTIFYLSSTTNGCTNPIIPVTARVTPPAPVPTAVNATICSGSSAHLHADAPAGIFDWFSTATGGTSLISSPDYTTPTLTATTTYYVQTTLAACVSQRTPVTVTVNPNPDPPVTQTDTICPNSNVILSASATPTGTYQWFDSQSGGNLLANGTTYTTPVLSHAITYYVQNSNSSCSSSRTPINVIINTPPDAPSVSEPLVCYGSAVTLTATAPGGNYQWYDSATGGKLLSSDTSYTTPALTASKTYYVQTTVNGCLSARKAVKVTILAPVAGPKAVGASLCAGNSVALTASGFTSYDWYDSATGGNYLSSGSTYITPVLTATTTFYVQGTTVNGCATNRTAVIATVVPAPAAPTASSAPVCPGSISTLIASSGSNTVQWYDAATDGNLLATTNTYTTPPLNTNTTYYIQSVSTTGCTSSRIPVVAQVISVPSPQFEYSSGTFCPSATNTTPTIYNPGGTFSAPAGLIINKTTGQINAALSIAGQYVVSYTGVGVCPITGVTKITITSSPKAGFSYQTPVCLDSTDPLPIFSSGASAGIFSEPTGGITFYNTTTGEVDLKNSKAGKYTITNTISGGGCPMVQSTYTLVISAPVIISAGPDQTVIAGKPVQLAGSVTGATGKWSGGKGSFSNSTSPTAIYTPLVNETLVKLTFTSINPVAPCTNKSASVTIRFISNSVPLTPTAASVTICTGASATLSATAPGGDYVWYNKATGGSPLATGANFTTPVLSTTKTYYVQTTVAGLTSPRAAVTVTVTSNNAPPVVAAVPPVCRNSSATLQASGSTTNYMWYDAAVGGNLLSVSNPYVTQPLTANTSFYVQSSGGSCAITRTRVDVVVNSLISITSAPIADVCSGDAQAYTITSNISSAKFLWSRAKVTGISNAAVSAQTASTITEALINTTLSPVHVTYLITPVVNGCSGSVFSYVVTVNPKPKITSPATTSICNGTSSNYTITFNDPTTVYSWSRDTITGISNSAVSSQTGPIQEVLFNTTNTPINVAYTYNYQNSNSCNGTPFKYIVIVNPTTKIVSPTTGIACNGTPQGYNITSNIPSATFVWSRAAVAGITNPPVSNQTSSTINEALVNTSATPVKVTYTITATANGCPSAPFTYVATVNNIPPAPVAATSNSPVCLNSTIQLNTPVVFNAKYIWTGPNGFTSTLQNPKVDSVTESAAGLYSVYVIVGGCTSPPDTVSVQVEEPPIAHAGADQNACIAAPSIKLDGTVTGGAAIGKPGTGIWTTSGTGVFLPEPDSLNAQYQPSAQDVASGSVKLTLASTSKSDCSISTSTMTLTFSNLPGVNAGGELDVCAQTSAVQLNGRVLTGGSGTWTTSGSGKFIPYADDLNAVYVPSTDDIKQGLIKLTLRADSPSPCFLPTDSLIIKFIPPASVSAGNTRYVLQGYKITLNPTVSDEDVHYLWSPNVDMNSDTVKNPVVTGDQDITYTLTITDKRGCVAASSVRVIVSPQLTISNAFTPNGDGINDRWDVVGLVAYEKATIDVFNRYGQKVFHSLGYATPWDGTYNGSPLPMGVYYYVINTNVKNQVLSGSLTIIR